MLAVDCYIVEFLFKKLSFNFAPFLLASLLIIYLWSLASLAVVRFAHGQLSRSNQVLFLEKVPRSINYILNKSVIYLWSLALLAVIYYYSYC